MPGMRDRTIILHGTSKAYAMTGWRVGYLAAPREFISKVRCVRTASGSHQLEELTFARSIVAGRLNRWSALAVSLGTVAARRAGRLYRAARSNPGNGRHIRRAAYLYV